MTQKKHKNQHVKMIKFYYRANYDLGNVTKCTQMLVTDIRGETINFSKSS